jgi:hypothetical protein
VDFAAENVTPAPQKKDKKTAPKRRFFPVQKSNALPSAAIPFHAMEMDLRRFIKQNCASYHATLHERRITAWKTLALQR